MRQSNFHPQVLLQSNIGVFSFQVQILETIYQNEIEDTRIASVPSISQNLVSSDQNKAKKISGSGWWLTTVLSTKKTMGEP